MLIEILCFVLVLYILVRLWYSNYTKRWNHFEQAPIPRYTLVGQIPSIAQMSIAEQDKYFHQWFQQSETDSFILWVGLNPWLCTRDRSLFESILSSNKHISKSDVYWPFRDWLGTSSVFLANGDSWRRRRKLLTPSFHFNILEDFTKIMEKHALELVDALKKSSETEQTFNAFKIMKTYAMGIIMETAMGVESNVVRLAIDENSNDLIEEKDRHFLDMIVTIERVLETLVLRDIVPFYWYNPIFRLFPKGAQYFSDLKKIKRFTMDIIEERIKKLEDVDSASMESVTVPTSSSGKGTIFLDKLLALYKNRDVDVEDILEETQTFIFAGHDTVATALSWSLYMLGRHKVEQDKAHEEAARVKAKGLPISESLRELHYIECVIKEVLRIHPSAGAIARGLTEEFKTGTQCYPEGTWIFLFIHEIQRDSKNFEDPMVFKPERFLHVEDGVNIKENRHYTYVPFSAGPRNCIGQRFAMMELKITLFHLLSEYEVIALQREEDLRETFGVIHSVENENGLEIKLRRR